MLAAPHRYERTGAIESGGCAMLYTRRAVNCMRRPRHLRVWTARRQCQHQQPWCGDVSGWRRDVRRRRRKLEWCIALSDAPSARARCADRLTRELRSAVWYDVEKMTCWDLMCVSKVGRSRFSSMAFERLTKCDLCAVYELRLKK